MKRLFLGIIALVLCVLIFCACNVNPPEEKITALSTSEPEEIDDETDTDEEWLNSTQAILKQLEKFFDPPENIFDLWPHEEISFDGSFVFSHREKGIILRDKSGKENILIPSNGLSAREEFYPVLAMKIDERYFLFCREYWAGIADYGVFDILERREIPIKGLEDLTVHVNIIHDGYIYFIREASMFLEPIIQRVSIANINEAQQLTASGNLLD